MRNAAERIYVDGTMCTATFCRKMAGEVKSIIREMRPVVKMPGVPKKKALVFYASAFFKIGSRYLPVVMGLAKLLLAVVGAK